MSLMMDREAAMRWWLRAQVACLGVTFFLFGLIVGRRIEGATDGALLSFFALLATWCTAEWISRRIKRALAAWEREIAAAQ